MKTTVLITGASRGIGAAIARACATQFDQIIITYRQQKQSAELLVTELQSQCDISAYQLDVADDSAVIALFNKIDSIHGSISALVNNAGIVAMKQRLEQLDAERLQKVFAVNCFGSFYCSREAVKRMSIANGGHGGNIVNITSGAARLGSPGEYIDYAAAKGAIETMTVGLAKEVAKEGIRVNAVSPGTIDTDIHADSGDRNRPQKVKDLIPMGRPGTAEEIANAVSWVLSDKASYVTGAILPITGGI